MSSELKLPTKPVERVNILLVDDQPSRLMSYQAVLHELGENLITANSGEAALGLLMQTEFALILLDVSMPGMDGFETASLIHDHPRFENTPIIFVTGVNTSEFDRLKGYKLGAVDYVFVPVVPEILRSKVLVLVELYRQRRQLQALNSELASSNAELARANSVIKVEKAKELEQLNRFLEQANQQLMQAARRKDEFLAILGHELRNPLASICNALEVIRLKQLANPDPELIYPREVLTRQIAQLSRLVDDLLDVARITRDQIELRREPLNLIELVETASEASLPSMQARGQRLDVSLPEQPIPVYGDATRLSQVLANLLNNAGKYSPDDTLITLDLRVDGGEAICRISDQGLGIPEEMHERIFEPFTQLQPTRDQASGGLGMGLAIVRKLVVLHGGSVSVSSAGQGQGSTFEVRLPLAEASSAAVLVESQSPGHHESGPTRRRVLIADDDRDSVNSLAMMLRLNGHEVCTASNGKEAVELAETFVPDAVLLDIGMPVMDGYHAAREIRSQHWGRSLFLVALTGWGQEEDRVRTAAAGFDEHRVKPISAREVLGMLAALTAANAA